MSYNNTNYEYGSYIKPTLSAGVYTYSYSSLTLNPSLSDQDQIIVVRKFTPTSAFEAATAPGGLGGVKITGAEYWDAWTLPATSTSGSPMYTVDTVGQTITMSTTDSDYSWNRNGTDITLPAFDPSSDELFIVRRTAGVTPFVTWQSSSKLTADQLNLETKQLLYSVQETLDELKRFRELNPFYNSAEGLCPLDSTGVVPEANLGANSVISALEGRTVATGTGLTGGGSLASDLTLAVDTSSFPYTAGKGLTYDSGSQLDIEILNGNAIDSGLNFGGNQQLYVYTANNLVTDVSSRALSAAQGVVLKGLIDAVGTGVRYLGSVTPKEKATATFTFTDKPNETTTITLEDADGTSLVFEVDNDNDGAAGSNIAMDPPTNDAAGMAAELIAEVNGEATLDIVASSGGGATGEVLLTQGTATADGNTTIGFSDYSNWNANTTGTLPTAFTGGVTQSTFPAHIGSDYAAGDTVDVLGPGTVVTPAVGGGADSDTLSGLTEGLDIRYNGTDWYNAGTTATIDTSLFVYVDGSSTLTGALDLGSQKIVNLDTPTLDNDGATKLYVDGIVATKILSTLNDVTGTATGGDIIKRNAGNTEWVLVPPSDTTDGIKIDDLSNTNITSVANNDLLVYNSSSAKWLNSSTYSTPQTWYSGGAGANELTGGLTGGFGNGEATNFTLGEAPASTVPSAFIITFDGVIQQASTYTITGTTLAFTTAPPYGVEIYIVCLGISREVTGAINATTLDVSAAAEFDSTVSVGRTLGVTGASTLTSLALSSLVNTSASADQVMSIVQIKWWHNGTSNANYGISTNHWRMLGSGSDITITPKKAGNKIILMGNCVKTGSANAAWTKNLPTILTGTSQWDSDLAANDEYNKKIIRPPGQDAYPQSTREADDLTSDSSSFRNWSSHSGCSQFQIVVDSVTAEDMATGPIRYAPIYGEWGHPVNIYPHYGNQFMLVEIHDPNNDISWYL